MQTESAEFVQAREPASGTHKGEQFVVNPSTIMASDDELVRAFPHLFKPLEASRQRPAVEEMTAEPGVKRGTEPVKRGPGRPRKNQ